MKIIVKNQHEQPKQVSLVLRRDLLDLKKRGKGEGDIAADLNYV